MANHAIQKMILDMFAQEQEQERKKIQAQNVAKLAPGLMGQQGQAAGTEQYQMQSSELFPGETQGGVIAQPDRATTTGLMQDTPAVEGTGVYNESLTPQVRNQALIQRMLESGNPTMLQQGLGLQEQMQEGLMRGANATPREPTTFNIGAENGMVQRARYIPNSSAPGGYELIREGEPRYTSNPFADTGTKLVNRYNQSETIDIENQQESADKERGKQVEKSRAVALKKINTQNEAAQEMYNDLSTAVQALRDGANTGPLASRLPSFRAAAVKLDNIKNKMAINVVNMATFGALSEKELALAKAVGLPDGLEEDELMTWLQDKQSVVLKMMSMNDELSAFLEQGGSKVEFMRNKRRAAKVAKKEDSDSIRWAKANPTDPRAIGILQAAGGR